MNKKIANTVTNPHNNFSERIKTLLFDNKVMIVFAFLCFGAFMVSGMQLEAVVGEVFTRIARNGFTVLSLLIPVFAGMGLNFGIVIGAIAAQISVFAVVYWRFTGLGGMMLAVLLATPMALLFGYLVGKLFNKMKGAEMIAGLIMGYFADGLYQLLFLVLIGGVIPATDPRYIIDGGMGVKNAIDLTGSLKYSIDRVRIIDLALGLLILVAVITVVKLILHLQKRRRIKTKDLIIFAIAVIFYALTYVPAIEKHLFADRINLVVALPLFLLFVIARNVLAIYKNSKKPEPNFNRSRNIFFIALSIVAYILSYVPSLESLVMSIDLPVLPYVLITGLCAFNNGLLNTRLGQNMRTVGQSQTVAAASGINVDRTRVIAMMLSTVLACWGQLIYLQNIGTFSTYGAHLQIGQFAVAALLVGGASVSKATNKQALIGVTLFHLLFIIAPQAGNQLFGDAQVGEYFRVFVSYGVIALSLAMHAWQRKKPLEEISAD
ncbi:MAG: ABC transporter permease subunit [Saccharofermentanales bacterium]|jgi:simple sugar transport system permease protein|nr:ABC transporter permease [Bacillota bacterium]